MGSSKLFPTVSRDAAPSPSNFVQVESCFSCYSQVRLWPVAPEAGPAASLVGQAQSVGQIDAKGSPTH